MKIIQCNYDDHTEEILAIFNDAIIHSTALYDYEPRTHESMVDWFKRKQAGNFPVIGVTDNEDNLLGFASYGTFRAWPAYKYSIEHSVYIHKDHRGKGLGILLMQELIASAIKQNYHTMVGVIDMDNTGSIALHTKLGFFHTGTLKQSGFKFGRWLDVVLYQLILPTPENPVDG